MVLIGRRREGAYFFKITESATARRTHTGPDQARDPRTPTTDVIHPHHMKNNAVAVAGRPSRTKTVPLRLQGGGESGAAAGHGVAQITPAGAVQLQPAPSGMVRQAVHSRVTPHTDTQQGVPPGAGLMPGFMDGEGAKARRVAVRKILNDKQFGEGPGNNWSESESSDDDNGKDAPMSSGSSNNVSVEESTAPSDIGSQESGDVDSGDVESGDIVFAKEIREATFGGGGAGRKKNHGKRKASAGGSAVGNRNSTKASLGASAKKARGKDYPLWAAHLLRRTCAHRKIPRMSKEGDKHVLVQALRSHDGNMNRPSPYYDDLNAITAGEMLVLCRFVVDESHSRRHRVLSKSIGKYAAVERSVRKGYKTKLLLCVYVECPLQIDLFVQ